jgi:lysozyme
MLIRFCILIVLSFTYISASYAQGCIKYLAPKATGIHPLSAIATRYNGIYGIDVSHHQGLIDWPKAKQAGVAFAYVKASEGGRFIDPCFRLNWKATRTAGVVRGAYHFFHANIDATVQAKNFVKQVKPLLTGYDLPPALDIEYVPDMNTVDSIALMAHIKQWLEYVEHELGIRPVIYTSQSFWHDYIGHNPVFTKYPLWLSSAVHHPGPPSSWHEWTFWQFTVHGQVPGIIPEVDLSFFGGSKQEFLQLITRKSYPEYFIPFISYKTVYTQNNLTERANPVFGYPIMQPVLYSQQQAALANKKAAYRCCS